MFGQIYILGDIRLTAYILERWQSIAPDAPLPKLRYWLVINNIIREQPTTVQPSWTSVISRANKATYKHLIIEPMNLLATNARLIKERYDMDVEVNWVAIPREFAFPEVSNEFDPAFTIPLADLGASMGTNPNIWKTALTSAFMNSTLVLATPMRSTTTRPVPATTTQMQLPLSNDTTIKKQR